MVFSILKQLRLNTKIPIPKKTKLIVCLPFFMLLLVYPTRAAEYKKNPQDEAVFRYRDLLTQGKPHDPKLLKKILLMQLEHENFMVRFNVAEVLGELNDLRASEILWSIITKEAVSLVRQAAVEGLTLTQNKLAVPYCLKLLDDHDVLIRRFAAINCGKLGDESIRESLEKARSPEEDELNGITIALALAKFGDKKKQTLVEEILLSTPSPHVRRHIIELLDTFALSLDGKILQRAFKNETDEFVKIWIARLLTKKGNKNTLVYLKGILANNKTANLRSEAAKALVHLKEWDYVYPFLLELLKEKDWTIRERTIENLCDLTEYPLVSIFILGEVLLTDENHVVREIAAWALGERKDKRALPYLENGLYDDTAFVRTGVIAAIYKILNSPKNKEGHL